MKTKTCTRRGECVHKDGPELPLAQFSNNKYSADSLQGICKECSKAYSKKYYEDHKSSLKALRELNKEARNRYQRDYYELNKVKVSEYQAAWRENNPDYHVNYYKNKGVT